MWELTAQLVTYESKALELVQNALFWCLGNFMSESKGNCRYWTYKRQLCCAFSETQETSKQTNAGEKELKKNTNQKKKKSQYGNNFTDIGIFWTYNMWDDYFYFIVCQSLCLMIYAQRDIKMYSCFSIHRIKICLIPFHQICMLLWLCTHITQTMERLGRWHGS